MTVQRSARSIITKSLSLYLMIVISCDVAGTQKCGKTLPDNRESVGKIIGGHDVGFYKYPWFAALQADGETACGGALIAPNIVVTAAHCFDSIIARKGKLENAYSLVLGMYSQCKNESTQKSYKTMKVQIHEKYSKNKPYYDIALLTLDGDTSGYEPICLPPKPLNDNEQVQEAWIAGFGRTELGGKFPCVMNEAKVLIYDTATCKNMVNLNSNMVNERNFINAKCAGYIDGGVDSCAGDSGGPLMTVVSKSMTWQLVGIVSYGWGCGGENAMGVYTDVSKYLYWIREKSGFKKVNLSLNHSILV